MEDPAEKYETQMICVCGRDLQILALIKMYCQPTSAEKRPQLSDTSSLGIKVPCVVGSCDWLSLKHFSWSIGSPFEF